MSVSNQLTATEEITPDNSAINGTSEATVCSFVLCKSKVKLSV
jgi:hypothetical protein